MSALSHLRLWARLALFLFAVLIFSRALNADSYVQPGPETYTSASGKNQFLSLPLVRPHMEQAPKTPPVALGVFLAATRTIFDPARERDVAVERRPLWHRELVNIPAQVFVSDHGYYVVTVDGTGRSPYEHALVVYGSRGKVVLDLPVEALLRPEEIKELSDGARRTVSHVIYPAWANYRTGVFSPDGKIFSIQTQWGRPVAVELEAGRVLNTGSEVK